MRSFHCFRLPTISFCHKPISKTKPLNFSFYLFLFLSQMYFTLQLTTPLSDVCVCNVQKVCVEGSKMKLEFLCAWTNERHKCRKGCRIEMQKPMSYALPYSLHCRLSCFLWDTRENLPIKFGNIFRNENEHEHYVAYESNRNRHIHTHTHIRKIKMKFMFIWDDSTAIDIFNGVYFIDIIWLSFSLPLSLFHSHILSLPSRSLLLSRTIHLRTLFLPFAILFTFNRKTIGSNGGWDGVLRNLSNETWLIRSLRCVCVWTNDLYVPMV